MQIQRANDRDPWPNLGPQTGQPIPIDVGIQTTDRGAVWRDKITVQETLGGGRIVRFSQAYIGD